MRQWCVGGVITNLVRVVFSNCKLLEISTQPRLPIMLPSMRREVKTRLVRSILARIVAPSAMMQLLLRLSDLT